jgi:hypothetical protein
VRIQVRPGCFGGIDKIGDFIGYRGRTSPISRRQATAFSRRDRGEAQHNGRPDADGEGVDGADGVRDCQARGPVRRQLAGVTTGRQTLTYTRAATMPCGATPDGGVRRTGVQVVQCAGLRRKQTATSALPVPRRALHPMWDEGRCRLYLRRKIAIPVPTRQRPSRIKPGSPMAGAAASNLGGFDTIVTPAHAAAGSKSAATTAMNLLAIVPSVECTVNYSLRVLLSIGHWVGTRPALRVTRCL